MTLTRDKLQGPAGYVKYRSQDRAMRIARKLDLSDTHSHELNGMTIHMPGGNHRDLNDELRKRGFEETMVPGQGGGMGMMGGGIMGDIKQTPSGFTATVDFGQGGGGITGDIKQTPSGLTATVDFGQGGGGMMGGMMGSGGMMPGSNGGGNADESGMLLRDDPGPDPDDVRQRANEQAPSFTDADGEFFSDGILTGDDRSSTADPDPDLLREEDVREPFDSMFGSGDPDDDDEMELY